VIVPDVRSAIVKTMKILDPEDISLIFSYPFGAGSMVHNSREEQHWSEGEYEEQLNYRLFTVNMSDATRTH
jgi:hypothetical protein